MNKHGETDAPGIEWKTTIRPRALEILEVLSFLGGVTLTALIASGVLLWGPIGLGICATLAFLGASHLFGTLSWTPDYYKNDNGNPWRKNVNVDEDKVNWVGLLKFMVLPLVFFVGGILLIVLGSLGIMGLGLGLGLGIPSIVSALSWFINLVTDGGLVNKEGVWRGVWLAYIAVVGMIAAATFLFLGFAGILAWPSVLAFGAPAAIAAIVIPIVGIAIGSTDWIRFRTRTEELLEPVLFFGSVALTVLISFGILPFGGVGVAVCSILTFFSASRFLATNSWSNDHNYYRSDAYNKRGMINDTNYGEVNPTKIVFSVIGVLAGIALSVLGATGVFGLGLGLALGIPIFSASVIGLVSTCMYNRAERKFEINKSDNVWSVATAISGVIAAGVSLGLGFGGFLALPVAIAIAVPSAVFSALIGLIHGAMFWLSKTGPESCKWLKNIFLEGDDDAPVVDFLGIGRYKLKKKEETADNKTSGETLNETTK